MQKIHRIFFQVAVVSVMLSVLLVGGASGFIADNVQKLKTTNKCPNCDLRGAGLSNANLGGASLSSAYLRVANLSGENLSSARWTDESLCKGGSFGTCIK
jgi:hypothetical protein